LGIINVDLNPIEHVWDILGRRVQAVYPSVQNLRQLEAAYIALGMGQLPQQHIRPLTGGMRRGDEAIIQARGGFTRHGTLNHGCR